MPPVVCAISPFRMDWMFDSCWLMILFMSLVKLSSACSSVASIGSRSSLSSCVVWSSSVGSSWSILEILVAMSSNSVDIALNSIKVSLIWSSMVLISCGISSRCVLLGRRILLCLLWIFPSVRVVCLNVLEM